MEQIVIYGAGKKGKQYYDFLESQGMEHIVYAFCDQNYKQIQNVDIVSVMPYCKLKNCGMSFVIAVVESEEICKLLQDDKQVFYNDFRSWIKGGRLGDVERIKMWLAYKDFEFLKRESEGTLNNLNKEIGESIKALKLDKAVRVYEGFCPCCMRHTLFVSYHYWLRDHYKCIFCNSIPRQRALMDVLEREVPEWRRLKIHESSPGGSSFHTLQEQCKNYTYSYWYESRMLGEALGHNVTNQNLEELQFENEKFDVFITQDVLEHINQPEKALAEINRTLKVGGVHVFTTPIYPYKRTRARIEMVNGKRRSVLPEIYHGNPISDKGSLVTFEWGGLDFIDMIEEITGMESKIVEFPNSKENFEKGLEGDFLQIIVSKKLKK